MASEPNATQSSSDADGPSLGPGDVLADRYRIVESLGSGGFGEVYAAEDEQREAPVALKILRPDAGKRDPSALARMRQEAQILEAIDHPNIVGIHDRGTSEHGQYMALELLDGPSIAELLETEGPAAAGRVEPITEQLLSALAASHEKQVLHRDLKPDNIILVDDSGGTEIAKLVDFGTAKARELPGGETDEGITLVRTRGGDFVGTPRYCAPEAAVGDPTGPNADLFSLGLVLAEWLTGTPRIEAEKQNEVIALLIRPEPLDVTDCPRHWRPWLQQLLAKPPEERYQTAEEALEAFVTLVLGEGNEETHPTVEEDANWQQPDSDDEVSPTAETEIRRPPFLEETDEQAPPDLEASQVEIEVEVDDHDAPDDRAEASNDDAEVPYDDTELSDMHIETSGDVETFRESDAQRAESTPVEDPTGHSPGLARRPSEDSRPDSSGEISLLHVILAAVAAFAAVILLLILTRHFFA